MNPTQISSDDNHESEVFAIVQRYLQQIEAGEHPSRAGLEKQYPELVATMEPYLDAIEMLHAAAPQLRDASNASERQPEPPSLLPLGEPLGDFRLIREIGRGGMGVVYEAQQLSLNRKVAVKILPFAASLDSRQLQRFRNEAQAAAALHHPHIVPVYGVGCERGVHFYVMQLIEGQNLAALINRLQSDPHLFAATAINGSEPLQSSADIAPVRRESQVDTGNIFSRELTTQRASRRESYYRTVATMIMQAADALDYAHSLGIVHRDVKPANLLVDDNGSIWVADFGLALMQTDHALTHTGDLLGTLRYMSPEQAAGHSGQVDQRTDVYALGATLYELLTLRPLFTADNRQSLLRQILEEEPRTLRSLDRGIPRELEIITHKALEKSPDERYRSIREIKDDLQRFLNDLPIRARTPSLVERLAKWARRHRGMVASGIAALALTVAGLSVATWMTATAYDRERAKAIEAATQYERAERNFRQARAAVDDFARIADETLADHPAMESARLRILEATLAYYQNFVDQHGDDPTLQAELETSRAKVEAILNELTTLAGAGRYRLLQQPEVQRELHLTADQIQPLLVYDDQWRELMRDTETIGRSEREQRRLDLAKRQDADVKRLLTEKQLQRFQQIVWQEAGPKGLDDTTLADALQLTTAQRAEIRLLLREYQTSRPGPPPFRGPADMPPPQMEPRRMGPGSPPDHSFGGPFRTRPGGDVSLPNIERLNAALQKVLTAEQQRHWQERLGEPLSFPLPWKPSREGSFHPRFFDQAPHE